MAKPRIATIADAVLAQMNTKAAETPSGWSHAFEIDRVYLEREEKKNLDALQIRIMCGKSIPAMTTRRHRQWTHEIMIGVRQNVDPTNADAVDSLAEFAESIAEYWSSGDDGGKRLVTGTAATIAGVEYLPYTPDVAETDRTFLSVITLTAVEVVAANPRTLAWIAGTYSGGTGVSFSGQTGSPTSQVAYTYINHRSTQAREIRAKLSLNGITASNLAGKYYEIGLGVRNDTSGAGLRNGYYCILRVEYSGGSQTVTQLRIYDENATLLASASFTPVVGLSTVYSLIVADSLTSITAMLANEEGTQIYATVAYSTTTDASNTGAAVYFGTDAAAGYTLPYISGLKVYSPP